MTDNTMTYVARVVPKGHDWDAATAKAVSSLAIHGIKGEGVVSTEISRYFSDLPKYAQPSPDEKGLVITVAKDSRERAWLDGKIAKEKQIEGFLEHLCSIKSLQQAAPAGPAVTSKPALDPA